VDKKKGVGIIRKSGKAGSLKKTGFVHF